MSPRADDDPGLAGSGTHRAHARAIVDAAIASVDGGHLVDEQLEVTEGDDGRSWLRVGDELTALPAGRVFVIGAGKVAAPMAAALECRLEGRIVDGLVISTASQAPQLHQVTLREAAHPLPDDRGVAATRELLDIANVAGADDLVVCVISGGASALLVQPAAGIDLQQLRTTTEALLASGAPIDDVNAVRRHLSAVKGGRLAAAVYPAALLTLVLSDVVGNELTAIGSGPTVPDPTSFADCLHVVETYGLDDRLPAPVRERLRRGAQGQLPENPAAGSAVFERVSNLVVGDNRRALGAAAEKAVKLGYRPFVLTTTLQGEARMVGGRLAALGASCVGSGGQPPTCLLAGGETTVTLQGAGKGGRNQEAALGAALHLQGAQAVTFASVGTDGIDGPTDAAGALADGATVERGRARGLEANDFLLDNDSYSFFEALGDLIRTGPTRTNVMDLQLVLVGAVPHG